MLIISCKGIGVQQAAADPGHQSPRSHMPPYGQGAFAGAPGPQMHDTRADNQGRGGSQSSGGPPRPFATPFAPLPAANAAEHQDPQSSNRKRVFSSHILHTYVTI